MEARQPSSTSLLPGDFQSPYEGRCRLRFVSALEADFQHHYACAHYRYLRSLLGVFTLIQALFAGLDLLLLEEAAAEAIQVRLQVGLPLLLGLWLLFLGVGRHRFQQPILLAWWLVHYGLMLWVATQVPGHWMGIYLGACLIVEMAALTIARLQMGAALVLVGILVLSSLAVTLSDPGGDPLDWWGYVFLDVIVASVGLLSVWFSERAARQDFLQRLLLQREQTRLAEANQQLSQLADRDGLTGVANRRCFDAVLDNEYRRAQREGQPLSLIIIDVDYFKPYNDHYGHPRGDAVLQAIAGALQHHCRRSSDRLARYGGEEFVVVLPGFDERQGQAAAETLRAAVEALQIPHAASPIAPHVTISVGGATLSQWGVDAAALLEEADRNLYRAKQEAVFVNVVGTTSSFRRPLSSPPRSSPDSASRPQPAHSF